jgi:hypothetical protein
MFPLKIPIYLVYKDPALTKLPTAVTGNGAIGLARGLARVQMVIGSGTSTVEFVVVGKSSGCLASLLGFIKCCFFASV